MSMNKKAFIFILIIFAASACNRQVYVAPTPTLPNPQIWQDMNNQAQSELSVSSEQQEPHQNPLQNSQADIQVDFSCTEANPCTDPIKIEAFLRYISDRYLADITKPGWYTNPDSFHLGGIWVYIDDPQTTHIQEIFMLVKAKKYSNPYGSMIVNQVLLPDRKNCGFSINADRTDVICTSINRLHNPVYTLIDGVELESHFLLGNYFLNVYIEIAFFSKPDQWDVPRQIDESREAWFNIEQGVPVLVVKHHSEGLGGLKCQDCTARSLSAESTLEFNWNTGELISEKSLVLYDDGSQAEWEMPPETLRQYHYQYYDALPAEIEKLYVEAAQKTREVYRLKGID